MTLVREGGISEGKALQVVGDLWIGQQELSKVKSFQITSITQFRWWRVSEMKVVKVEISTKL